MQILRIPSWLFVELENGIDHQLVLCSESTMGIIHWHEESHEKVKKQIPEVKQSVTKKWCAPLPGIVITYRNIIMS